MKNNQKKIQWLWTAAGKTKGLVCLLVFFEIAMSAIGVGYALVLRSIINAADAALGTLFWQGVGILAALLLLRVVLRTAVVFLEERAIVGIENKLKFRLFSFILEKDYASVSTVHSGEWMNRLTTDVVQVATNVVKIVPSMCGMVFKLLFAIGMLVLLEPRFLYLILPGGCILLIGTILVRPYSVALNKRVQEKNGRLRIFMQEILGSIMAVRAFVVRDEVLHTTKKHMLAHYKARMQRTTFSAVISSGFSFLMQCVYVLGVIFCGSGILYNRISYGDFTAVLQLIGQVQAPFASMSGVASRFFAMLASVERLMEAEEMPASAITPLPAGEVEKAYATDFSGLYFQNVDFTYHAPIQNLGEVLENETETTVFENMNLEILKGEYVALTGDSGCGKSTVLKLLLSLYTPEKGRCYVKFGEKEETLTVKWQRLFAYVPQGNFFMSGTIRETVAFFDKERMQDEEALYHALRIACADTFVDALENGLDTMLGERGQGLSDGQMQRLGIARAIFSGRPILMLDESTSALDAQTEAKVLENLRTMTNKTVLIITHRPAALSICDKVMEFGKDGMHVRNL